MSEKALFAKARSPESGPTADQSAIDLHWMTLAIELAKKGLYSVHPNPRVGCVIVSCNKQIAAGWHEFCGGAHAEINAINSAPIPAGCDFYISLEPCAHQGRTAPCVDAVIAQKPARVIVAMQDPNPKVSGNSFERMRQHGIEVVVGVMSDQAENLNPGFNKRMRHGLPFVSVKMATSADGKTALSNGDSKWISGEAARRDVQFLRAKCSAILTSAQTVLDDDASLSLRLSKRDLHQIVEIRHPLRVIIDSKLRLSGSEKIFQTEGEIRIYSNSTDSKKITQLAKVGAEVIRLEQTSRNLICLSSMMQDLAKLEINEIHTECGQSLAGALIEQGLVDQLVLYIAPHILGSQARGAFEIGELTQMDARIDGHFSDVSQIGDDLRLTLKIKAKP